MSTRVDEPIPTAPIGRARRGTIGIALALAFLGHGRAAAQSKVTYDDDVQRILVQNCGKCHGDERQRAGLNLSNYAGVLAGSSGGAIVEAGDPEASVLWLAITHRREPTMPPSGDKLPEKQIEIVRKWIEGGLLENQGSKERRRRKPRVELAAVTVTAGRPAEPPPMPEHLLLEPVVTSGRPGAITAIAANPWAPLVALGAHKQVLLHDTSTLELLGVLPFPEGTPNALSFSRDGRLLMAAGGRGADRGRAVVWNVQDGERVTEVGEELDAIQAADLCPDRSRIAIGTTDKLVKVLSTGDGEVLHELRKHTDWVTAVAYSPDSVLLATGDRNGNLSVWEAWSGREMHTLAGHTAAITGLSWRDDGNLLASCSEDGTIRLWEMERGSQVKNWGAHGGGVLGIAFAHDGRLASCGRDRVVKLWQGDGVHLRDLGGLGDLALEVSFDSSDARVIAGDWAGRVLAWNAADGAAAGAIALNPPTIAQRLELIENRVAELAAPVEPLGAARANAEEAAREPMARLAAARAEEESAARLAQERETAVAAIRIVPPEAVRSAEEIARLGQVAAERRALHARVAEAAAATRAAAGSADADELSKQAAATAEQAAAQLGESANAAEAAAAQAARDAADAKARAEAEAALAAARADLEAKRIEAERLDAESRPLVEAAAAARQAEAAALAGLASARRELRRWQAARVNVELHAARAALAAVESDREEIDAEAEAARAEVDVRRAALAAAVAECEAGPQRLLAGVESLEGANAAVPAALAAVESARADAASRDAAVAAYEPSLADLQQRAAQAPADAELAAAVTSAGQALDHLKAAATAAARAVEARLADAQTARDAVAAAEAALAAERASLAGFPPRILALRADLAAAEAALAAVSGRTAPFDARRAELAAEVARLEAAYRALLDPEPTAGA